MFKPNLWGMTNLVFGGVTFHFWIGKKYGLAFFSMNCQFSEMCIQHVKLNEEDLPAI